MRERSAMSDTGWYCLLLMVMCISTAVILGQSDRIDGVQSDCPKEQPQITKPNKVHV